MGWGELAQMVGGGIIGMSQGLINNQIMRNNQWPMGMTQLQLDNLANQQNINAQLDLWTKTNYPAQVEQLEKAGLNPALLYKSGGPGGTTAMAAGHVAPTAAGGQVDILKGMEIGAQLSLLKAQKENIEADTKNKLSEAHLNEGVRNQTGLETASYIHKQGELLLSQTKAQDIQNKINEATTQEQIKQIKYESIGEYLKNVLTEAQTKNTSKDTQLKGSEIEVNDQRITNMQEEIKKWINEIDIAWGQLSVEERKLNIQKMLAQYGLDDNERVVNQISKLVSAGKGTILLTQDH